MRIKTVETYALNIPFYCERVSKHMHRALTHSERVHVYRTELDNGIVGYGENLSDESSNIEGVLGQNPLAILQDDGIGTGIQMSLFDAVGKSMEVPAHQLLGTKVRDRCPISWWDIDMPPEDWMEEAKESIQRGYTSIKLKARPWRDIFDQVHQVGTVVPENYKFDIDFNGFLRTTDVAIPVLQELDQHPNVAYYESPFYLGTDLEGAGRLQAAVTNPIVEHFNEDCLHARVCGGFVVGGAASGTRRVGALCASFDKPFWLQMVGTGITTAYAMHLGAILTHAQLPTITCHELWEHHLLKERLEVSAGTIAVPELPGLGVEVDESALEYYRVELGTPTLTELYKQQKYLCRIHVPDGENSESIHDFAGESIYYPAFSEGEYPGFVRGVWMEVIEVDA